jgi:hypothetical protein
MATNQPKYPDVYVQLSGTDGNTGNIMGAVTRALKRHGVRLRQRPPDGDAVGDRRLRRGNQRWSTPGEHTSGRVGPAAGSTC